MSNNLVCERHLVFVQNAVKDYLDTILETVTGGNAQGSALDTVPATVNGGLWYELENSAPVVKIYYGGNSYKLTPELVVLADPQLSVSQNSINLSPNNYATVSLSYQGNGTITLQNDYPSQFTANLAGNSITIQANSSATPEQYTLDISLSSDGTYAAATTSLTVSITVAPPTPSPM